MISADQLPPLRPAHRWTAANKALAGAMATAILTDWQQTRAFRKQGEREGNPLLSSTPSEGHVNTLIGLGLLGALGAGIPMSSKARNLWYGGITGAEAMAVLHNALKGHRVSVRGQFPVGLGRLGR